MRYRIVCVGLAAAFLFQCEQETGTEQRGTDCDLDYAAARSDALRRGAYVAARMECDQETREARVSGKLLKVLYAPDDSILKSEMTKEYAKLGYSRDEISAFTNVSMVGLARSEKFAVAQISSTDLRFYGKGVPVYIIVNELAFSSPVVLNEHDARSILIHELQHVRDWHDGMLAGSFSVESGALADGKAGAEWLIQLLELRAVYRELASAYQSKAQSDSFHISYEWFASQASNYLLHWNRIDSLVRTDFESGATTAQKLDFRGVIPEAHGDSLLLHFELFGRRLTANFIALPSVPKTSAAFTPRQESLVFTAWKEDSP